MSAHVHAHIHEKNHAHSVRARVGETVAAPSPISTFSRLPAPFQHTARAVPARPRGATAQEGTPGSIGASATGTGAIVKR